jgi:hypothetical protein
MKTLSFFVALAIAAPGFAAVLSRSDDDAATLSQISNYRQWTRVNEEPVKIQVPLTTTDGISLATSDGNESLRMSVAS